MPGKSSQSPAWEKPRDIMKRHLLKRKSSRHLPSESSKSGLEPVAEATNDGSKFSFYEDSQTCFTESNPFKNITNSPSKKKRCCFAEELISEDLKLINWSEDNSKRMKNTTICESEYNSTIDWDDTTARSSFECSFVRKSSTTNFTTNTNGSFEDKLSQTINDSYPIDFSHFTSLCSSTPKTEINLLKKSASEIPLDVRIGNKLRIISKKPFPWMNSSAIGSYPVKISANDITAAMKLLMNGYAERGEVDGFLHKTPHALVQTSAMYYQSANPTTKPIFPRLEGTFSSRRSTKTTSEIADWTESFNHLCSTWQANQRDIFYVCSSSFTALFIRSPQRGTVSHEDKNKSSQATSTTNVVGKKGDKKSTHKIIVTPTTLGLRELLSVEGIRFTLPLRTNKLFVDLAEEECAKDFILPSNQQDEEQDEDEWLKEIGISPKSTLRLKKTYATIDFSKEMEKEEDDDVEKSLSVDSRFTSTEAGDHLQGKRKGAETSTEEASRSTVLITEPKSIEAFCRILRTLTIGVSRTGMHLGLPPTLLAASPFFGGHEKRLRMTSQITKKNGELRYILELDDGPILPSMPKLLVEFLNNMSSETKSSNAAPHTNRAQIQVMGRLPYCGMNEAMDSQLATNINEFEIDFASCTFSW